MKPVIQGSLKCKLYKEYCHTQKNNSPITAIPMVLFELKIYLFSAKTIRYIYNISKMHNEDK